MFTRCHISEPDEDLHFARGTAKSHNESADFEIHAAHECVQPKLEGHRSAIALHVAYYNRRRIHVSLRVTLAMEVGITDRVWTLTELLMNGFRSGS
jgi:hypothetical protein